MCRLAAAHEALRLMLLGLPSDMVHGVSLHRAHTSIFRNFLLKSHFKIICTTNKFTTYEMVCQGAFENKSSSGGERRCHRLFVSC